jgi:Nuclease-related domain
VAKTFGAAGEHTADQSVAAFRKTIRVYLSAIGALCFGEGVVVASLVAHPLAIEWMASAAVLLGIIWWAAHRMELRVKTYERNRLSYRAGFLGEHEVAVELERLPDEFTVFHNVNTPLGNFDHVVIGPTGFFAIETKNWSGHIAAAESGELKRNGIQASRAYVGQLLARVMRLREQIVALSGQTEIRIRGIMVFPRASLDAPFGKTRTVYCLRLAKLRDYIAEGKPPGRLSNEQIDQLARAMKGVAGMDKEFNAAGNDG